LDAMGLLPLAVLIERDVQIRYLLLGVVFAEIGISPAHGAAVPDSTDPGAQVASSEPHHPLEHEFYSRGKGPRNGLLPVELD